ncbi:type-1 angiotensin II receptor-like [Physella acuta]|uniref:type-1 angiotensin II receptor-like n=1 Tax=Physella acuta TaxID=109671 RepID=UPI0027DDDF53|nr:type-1 angiotensin II receptor-like [Physella acuta]
MNISSSHVVRPDLETTTLTLAVLNQTRAFKLYLSDHERVVFEVVTYVFLCGSVALFGIASNIVNVVIFFKQGLKTTMNISFFGLAISDLCSLVTLMWFSICMNPLFENSNIPFISREFQYLTGGWPSFVFARITSFITSFITAERCLCITSPLKVKHIITPRRTILTLIFIYIIIIICSLPEYISSYIGWKFHPPRNQTMLGLVFASNRKEIEGLGFIVNAVLGALSYILVIIFTTTLVFKLKHEARWRSRKTCLAHDNQSSFIHREKRAMNMVLLIAVLSIFCSTPGIILSCLAFVEEEFSILGHHSNVFHAAWSVGFLFIAINSSVNSIFYYNMSSKYKKSFLELFSRWKKTENNSLNDNYSARSDTFMQMKKWTNQVSQSEGQMSRPILQNRT